MVLTDATLSNISFSDTQIKIKRGTDDGLTIETPGDPSTLDASLVAGDTMYFLDGT